MQVVTERDEALRAVEEWEARCQQLEAEAEVLQAEVQRQELELAAGKADAETRGSAVAGLQTMLTSLQKACDQGRHAGIGCALACRRFSGRGVRPRCQDMVLHVVRQRTSRSKVESRPFLTHTLVQDDTIGAADSWAGLVVGLDGSHLCQVFTVKARSQLLRSQ